MDIQSIITQYGWMGVCAVVIYFVGKAIIGSSWFSGWWSKTTDKIIDVIARKRISELKKSIDGSDFTFDLQFFNVINNSVDIIFSKTSADRFLILFAVNGKTDFNYVTVIYERHKVHDKIEMSIGASRKYIRFEIDKSYRDLVKYVELNRYRHLDVKNMEDCILKNVYLSESVNYSSMYHLARLPQSSNPGNDLIIYSTIATHGEKEFTNIEKTLHIMAIDGIKAGIHDLQNK